MIFGDHNTVREHVTIHRSTGEGTATRIGSHNLIMASCHLAHNCQVGNHVCIATLSGMSGHTIIEDSVVIGGMVGSHQRVRVGTLAMVSGFSKMSQDVPPYSLVDGKPARVIGPNLVGLRRSGMTPEARKDLQRAFRLIYRAGLDLDTALEQVSAELGSVPRWPTWWSSCSGCGKGTWGDSKRPARERSGSIARHGSPPGGGRHVAAT